ncbi:MAG: aldehyde ferredoxin oxidoreductase family protein [Candidatus Abyssubacteria bacterium]
MSYYGYAGNILFINLSNGHTEARPLDMNDAAQFLGGLGLNNRLAFELIPPGIDPLAPENPIIIGAGPLIGTLTPGASRVVGTSKFPLSGAISAGSGSMTFGFTMKRAGYDNIVITGAAETPVYIFIEDDSVQILDAADVWGRDNYDAVDELWRRHGRTSSISIGQAGENLVKFSIGLIDKMATIGRAGFGAIMGAKKLKAILVRGSGGIRVADPKGFMHEVNQLFTRARKFKHHAASVAYGILNAGGSFMLGEEGPYGLGAYTRVKKDRIACPSCFIADKDVLETPDGEFAGMKTYTHSFGMVANTAMKGQIPDCDRATHIVNLQNRYGLGQQEFESLFDLIVEAAHDGAIREDQFGKIERNYETMRGLIETITFRKGAGDILAEGWTATVNEFGLDASRYTSHVKGLGTQFDPRERGLGTMEFEQLVNPRGGHHQSGGSPSYNQGASVEMFERHADRMGAPPDAVRRVMDSPLGFNVGRYTRYSEDWFSLFDSLGICIRSQNNRFYSADICARLFSTATGIEMDKPAIMRAAERVWNLYKVLNWREGFDRKADQPPDKWFEPLKAAGSEFEMRDYFQTRPLTRADLQQFLDDYYNERGWDPKTGLPTRAKLQELGLDFAIKDLEKRTLL